MRDRAPCASLPSALRFQDVGTVVGATPPARWSARWGADLHQLARAQHAALGLPADEIHIWRTELDVPTAALIALRGLLCEEERERAARFRFDRDRDRYVAGRGLLRMLLACYLDLAPEALRFYYGAYEKPYLAGVGLQFNLSHSGALAFLAVSATTEVGIDVELVTEENDLSRERIAERFFSPNEVAALRALPAAQQSHAFLRCWTRKEAFIKARGDGLSLPLDSFDVTLDGGHPPRLLRTGWSGEEPGEWRLADLSDPGGAFIAAVASRSTGWRVVSRRLEELVEGGPTDKENR